MMYNYNTLAEELKGLAIIARDNYKETILDVFENFAQFLAKYPSAEITAVTVKDNIATVYC